MDDYVENIVRDLTPQSKSLFLTVGPSGSGKSTLVAKLTSAIHERLGIPTSDISIHSLDDYRIRCNNGKYPNAKEHAATNRIAIPTYHEQVTKDTSNIIVLDNTHLKWDPDWQLPIKKATDDGYDLFVLVPPATEYLFLSNRSTHVDKDREGTDILLKMCARWPGHRMKHLLNRKIAKEILTDVVPSSTDSFSVNKLFHVQWGTDGFLYVLDNYLGYIDRNMVNHALMAGNMLRGEDRRYFMQKDSLLHMTLVKPNATHSDVLKKYAIQLTKTGSPPDTEYQGIGTMRQGENVTFYLVVEPKSQEAWAERLLQVGARTPLNPDGLHVTLGYRHKDIWNVRKTEANYRLFDGSSSSSPQPQFSWTWKNSLTKDNLVKELDVASSFLENVQKNVSHSIKEVTNLSTACRHNLELFSSHSNLKMKWRREVTVLDDGNARYYTLNVQIFSKGRPDDEFYKRFPLFQKIVPRGLTFVFKSKNDDSEKLHYVNVVFPTAKFFGDSDDAEEVKVMTNEEMAIIQTGASKYIATEKANGEMFTLTPVETDGGTQWIIAAGSKNNKFLFAVDTRNAATEEKFMEPVEDAIERQLETEGGGGNLERNMSSSMWTNIHVWAEMCMVTFRKLAKIMSPEKMQSFFTDLHSKRETLCGEFLSYLHPHIVSLSHGYKDCIYFATSTYDEETFYVHHPDALESLTRLNQLASDYGIPVVDSWETTETLEQLRKRIMLEKGTEGVVLLKCDAAGKLQERVKLKTLWYVVHRGFREKLRKFISGANKNERTGANKNKRTKIGSNTAPIDEKRLHAVLMETLKDKLKIFDLNMDCSEATEYREHVARLSARVSRESQRDLLALTDEFLYRYPGMLV